MDNQGIAKVLLDHKLVTREQLGALWPRLNGNSDIAELMVREGLLNPQIHRQLVEYIAKIEAGGAVKAESKLPPQVKAQEPVNTQVQSQAQTPANPPRNAATPQAVKPAAPPVTPKVPDGATPDPVLPVEFRGKSGLGEGSRLPPDKVDAGSTWEEILLFGRACGATDLHLSSQRPLLLRYHGSLRPANEGQFPAEAVEKLLASALAPDEWGRFNAKGDLEFVYTLPGAGRFRVTAMRHAKGLDITARVIPMEIRGFEESGLPEGCRELTSWAQGLVLVTGPAGCGKTSTLATLVEMVNQSRHDHIITVENPVEIVYTPAMCQITQRELGLHSLSRDNALRAALRQDPDIIVISELRDLQGISMAVSAAETGHLVFATMNTTNASRTIYRLIDSFPAEEQGIVRNMISESLRGVISQQLLPLLDGSGVVPAYEVLLVNSAVANLIRKDETHQLGTAMVTGKGSGMVLLDDSLRRLVETGLVAPEEAHKRANSPKDFERFLKKA